MNHLLKANCPASAGEAPFVPDRLDMVKMSKRADEVMRGRSTEAPRLMNAKQRAARRAQQGRIVK